MNNHSKIPSISFNGVTSSAGKEYPQVKRPRLSSPMLQDLTNQMNTTRVACRSSTDVVHTQNSRLMNKYVYGDAAVIEEVKKRERKILKDILHFKNAIFEIEKETSQIREVQLPDIHYSISKKLTICNELRKETAQLESHLNLKDGEIDLQRKNEELTRSNLTTKYSIEVQELENQLNKRLDDENAQWSDKLLELEDLKPDQEIAQEIELLKRELKEVEDKLSVIYQENNDKCRRYDDELFEELKTFQDSKKKPLDMLIEEQKGLKVKEERLAAERRLLGKEVIEIDQETTELIAKISEARVLLTETQVQNEPLKKKLRLIEAQHQIAKEQNVLIREVAHKKEVYYNSKFDKMEQEQLRRRRLENSIDESKGEIRRFAYVANDSDISTRYSIDYAGKSLQKLSTNKSYFFTRIIPSSLMSEHDLLLQEYEMYHEMCLQKEWNFNLISVRQSPSNALKMALIGFLRSKSQNSYKIMLQYVFLSEEVPSQDMLLQSDHGSQNKIELKIELDSLELDSKRIELTSDSDSLFTAIQERSRNDMSGIGVLKFQLIKESDLQGKPINFYFIEIHDKKTIKILDDSITRCQIANSPIALILKKLLSDTKSFFLFHIDKEQDDEALLEASKKLGKLKNIKTKPKEKHMLL